MKLLIIFILAIYLLGCEKRQTQITDLVTEQINFFSLTQKNLDDIPDKYISSLEYINIALDSNLLFNYAREVRIIGNKIYIKDDIQKVLGVFDMSGRGIAKIGDVGRAPGEYLDIASFSIDNYGNVHLIDGRLDKRNIYDSLFNFVASEKLPFEIDILQCLDDGGFLLGLSSWNKGLSANDKIIKTDSVLKPIETFCQYAKGTDPNYWISSYQFLQYKDYIIYNRFFDNNVYLFSRNGEALKSIYFDFGKKNVPEVALKNIEQKEEMFDRLCCLQEFTIVDDDYLLGYVWDERKDKIFLIDRIKNVLYLGEIDPFNKLGRVIGVCDKGIISCIYPGEYLEYKEQGKNAQLPEDVKEHLENEGVVLCLYSLNMKN